jgi:hypothetical protein
MTAGKKRKSSAEKTGIVKTRRVLRGGDGDFWRLIDDRRKEKTISLSEMRRLTKTRKAAL